MAEESEDSLSLSSDDGVDDEFDDLSNMSDSSDDMDAKFEEISASMLSTTTNQQEPPHYRPPPIPRNKPSNHNNQYSMDDNTTITNTDDQTTSNNEYYDDEEEEDDDTSTTGINMSVSQNSTDSSSPLKQLQQQQQTDNNNTTGTTNTNGGVNGVGGSAPPPIPQKPRRISTKPSTPPTTTTSSTSTTTSPITSSTTTNGGGTTSTTTTSQQDPKAVLSSKTPSRTGSGNGSGSNGLMKKPPKPSVPSEPKVIDDGQFRYTHIPPHRLVYTIETQVRMLNNDEVSYDDELKRYEERSENLTESNIEPFVGQLPLPPNCNLFKQALRFKGQLEELNNLNSQMNQLHQNRKLSNTKNRKQSISGQSRSRKQSIKSTSFNTSNGSGGGIGTSAAMVPHGAVRHVHPVKEPFPDEIAGKGVPIRIGLSKSITSNSNSNNSNSSNTSKKVGGEDEEELFKLSEELNKLPDIPFPPYNSAQLSLNSMNYIYEDHWQVENSRPLIHSTLLSPDLSNTTSTSTSNTSTSGNSTSIDRSKWRTRLLNKYPVMQEMSERLYPLWRTISFGELFNAGKKDVRKKLNDDHVLNIILQHLHFEGLKETKKTLEEETGKKYIGIDIDQSLLYSLCKEAVKKSEKLMDTIISDKYSSAYLQKNKNQIMKELDEQLSELGITNDEFGKRDEDVNIWKEPERQNEIVEFDPVSKFEQFQAGSLNRIIERLTIPTQDQSFIDVFLHTYMAIASPELVLGKLFQRFKIPSTFTPDVKNGIQSAVIRVLLIWIENHFHHFTNNMLQKLQSFLDEQVLIHAKLNKSRKKINEIITQMTRMTSSTSSSTGIIGLNNSNNSNSNSNSNSSNNLNRNNDKIPEPNIPWSKIFSSELCIEDIDGEEMARQLCLYEFDMYYSIKSEELLNQAWRKPKLKHRSPNVLNMMNFFENISIWVASLICRGQTTYARKHTYKMLIIVCDQLRKMNNFNTLRAILNGFENGAVKRLKETRSELGPKSRDTENLLKQLMSEENNYKKYKEVLKTSSFPAIPYLGVHLQDLQYIEENHNDYVKNTNRNGVELINWIKRESLFEVIKEIKHFQNPLGYKFVKVFQIQELIRTMPFKASTNHNLMIHSYKAEPPPGAGSNFFVG